MEGPLTIEIPDANETLYLPLNLSQCDQRQYIAFCELMYRLESNKIAFEEFKILATYELLGLKKGKREIAQDEIDQALATISQISEYIAYFFEQTEDDKVRLQLSYNKNHIKKVDFVNKSFSGPKDFFTDVSFGEYEEALNLFFEYQQSRNSDLLIRIMAIFYRPTKKGKRIPHNADHVEKRMKHLRHLDMGYLYGFYYTFAAFHNYFTSSSVVWEGKEIDMSIIFTDLPEDETDKAKYDSPYSGLGLKSIAFQLAESGVFGSLKEVRDTNLWEAALRLYDIRKRDLDYKAEQKLNEKKNK